MHSGLCPWTSILNILDSNPSKVCQQRPPYSKGGKSYPTCGLTCAAALRDALNSSPSVSTSSATPGPSSQRNRSYRGRGAAPFNPTSRAPRSPTSTADPTISQLTAHLGGHAHRRQPQSANRSNHSSTGTSTVVVDDSPNRSPPTPMVKCVVSPTALCFVPFLILLSDMYGQALSR